MKDKKINNISETKEKIGDLSLNKTIGKTTYQVTAFFSKTSTETMEDKIIRLIQNEQLSY